MEGDEGAVSTCTKHTSVFLADEVTMMTNRDDSEPNNDACCIAGIAAGSDDPLIHACEMNKTYEVTHTTDVK